MKPNKSSSNSNAVTNWLEILNILTLIVFCLCPVTGFYSFASLVVHSLIYSSWQNIKWWYLRMYFSLVLNLLDRALRGASFQSGRLMLNQIRWRYKSGFEYWFPLLSCCRINSRTRYSTWIKATSILKTTTNKDTGILISNCNPNGFLFLFNDHTSIMSFWFSSYQLSISRFRLSSKRENGDT